MIEVSDAAREQLRQLLAHYSVKGRFEAAQNLVTAYDLAVDAIGGGPDAGLPYPRPYASIAAFGLRWIKFHRYWFGYSLEDGAPLLTNVLYEAADLPSRVVDAHGLPARPLQRDGEEA